jgi:hypothetical protein
MTLILSGTNGLSDVDGSAATPAIRGTDTNTGIYFPGADRIGFSEGGVQVGEFDASGNFLMNSGYGSAAVAYGCRAWVNFNGTGTIAIRASGNVNYAIQMAVAGTGAYSDWSRSQWYVQSSITTSSFQISNVDENDSYYDTNGLSVTVFR